MADTAVPSMKDVESFTNLIAAHPGEAITAFVLLSVVAILIGVTSKLPTGWATMIALPLLLLLVGAGGFAIYRIVPSPNSDTAVVFKLALANKEFRAESRAVNTYVGGVDGDETVRRMIFRAKDDPADPGVWAKIRLARTCPPDEPERCVVTDYRLPVWALRSAEVQHIPDEGPGARMVLSSNSTTCTVFPGSDQTAKPKNYAGPNLCLANAPSLDRADNRWGSWWISTAWAADRPENLQAVRDKLASVDPAIRGEGRVDLQKARNAAELLDLLVAEPKGDAVRDRVVANALISAIYFGDEKWKTVQAPTKTRIMALLVDQDVLVSRYAKSVLRRYPEDDVLARVKIAATTATGDDKKKLIVAASDIEYNLGVTRLEEARADKSNKAKWKRTLDTFNAALEVGNALPDNGKQEPDVMKNYFGLALSMADEWSNIKSGKLASAEIKSAFSRFMNEIDPAQYPFTDQVKAASCVTAIGTTDDSQFEKSLGGCLKFFR